jgi:hypothetical protein
MAEEQASLTAEIPRLVRALATGDSDGDGTADFAPIGSLQAAVITTDMGVGGASVPTCPGRYGDDGVLITRGRTTIAGCMASYPPIFSFAPTDDPDGFSSELSCVATTGTGGCGFEQPLEAVLKALSPASATAWTAPSFVPPVFFDATSGHALGANAGFVRPDSLLVVVLVTDEEDCSALDPGVFDPLSSTYTGDLNLRCFNHPGALHPVARFVDGLAQLRLDPERLIVASIVGIPVGAEPATTVPRLRRDPGPPGHGGAARPEHDEPPRALLQRDGARRRVPAAPHADDAARARGARHRDHDRGDLPVELRTRHLAHPRPHRRPPPGHLSVACCASSDLSPEGEGLGDPSSDVEVAK